MDAVGELVLLRALPSVLFGACLNVMLFWLKHFKAKKRQRILCAFASMEVENSNTIFSNLEEVKAMMMMMMTAKFEEQSAQICALTIR